jgi:ribosomal protein S1
MMNGLRRGAMGKHDDMIPFEVKYIHQTKEALLVNVEGEDIWIPKSLIEVDEEELENACKGNTLSIGIIEWFATDNQLI